MSKSTDLKNSITVIWSSPSNIALIKYWGKHGRQLPMNASVSFTLSHARTITRVTATDRSADHQQRIHFTFEGKSNPTFSQRIEKFIDSVMEGHFPFLKDKYFIIESENTFPHSSGIASSAAGMSALALCLCDIEMQFSDKVSYDAAFYQKASMIARLGSGSASRSVYPYMSEWGKHQHVAGSSDEYGIDVSSLIDPVFKDFHDDILIISDKEKSVSSTKGHSLMENHPFAPARFLQAEKNLSEMMQALRNGDIETFGKITEDEALTLHALMMCSDPSFILMTPDSLEVINKIVSFRKSSGVPIYFTLDAGPNVHVLYPHAYAKVAGQFIAESLAMHCNNNRILYDRVGKGPEKLQ